MPIRTLRPTNNGSRHQALLTTDGLSKVAPEKALLTTLKKNGGRNNQGYITCRHKGGGHKQKYRIIDFKRSEFDGLTATVKTIEYDPNRTCRICLVCYENGQKRYILAPKGLNVGDKIVSGKAVDVQIVWNWAAFLMDKSSTTWNSLLVRVDKSAVLLEPLQLFSVTMLSMSLLD